MRNFVGVDLVLAFPAGNRVLALVGTVLLVCAAFGHRPAGGVEIECEMMLEFRR